MITTMKTKLGSLLTVVCLAVSGAFAESGPASKQLQIYPKNMARHHLGASLLIFDESTKTYTATEAAAAWLDDDVATGWPPLAGHHYYLLAMPEPQMIGNFCISARSPSGTVSLYAGDEPARPDAKSWAPLAKNLALDSINEKKLARPFNHPAKYLLIETNISDSGPWYSLYAYGDKPAISYQLQKRVQPVDMRSVLGPYVNPQVDFNLAALYSSGRVIYSNATEGFLSWQKAIDDNPESGMTITPSTDSGVVIRYDTARTIQRVSALVEPGARGKLDFFALKDAPFAGNETGSDYQKAALGGKQDAAKKSAPEQMLTQPVSVANMTPVVTMVFDGSSPRGALNFPPTQAAALVVRWTPDAASQPLMIREINSFSDLSPNEYEIALTPEAIGEYGIDRSKDGKAIADGKKAVLPPVGEQIADKAPFLPGPPVFPNIPPLGPISP